MNMHFNIKFAIILLLVLPFILAASSALAITGIERIPINTACGDGYCNGSENSDSCPIDCVALPTLELCQSGRCTNTGGTCSNNSDCTVPDDTGGGLGQPQIGDSFSQPPQVRVPTEGLQSFGQLIGAIFTWSLNILGIVVFVMIFFAGFQMFTAAGNTAKLNEAKGRITQAITGAIILLSAWIILYTINPDLVGGAFRLPGLGTDTATTPPNDGPGPGGGICADCECAHKAPDDINYRQEVREANASALNAAELTNASNTGENRQRFLDAVVAELRQAGLNSTARVLNGNDIPGSAIDLIAVWSENDTTMERYDILSGSSSTIGLAAQDEYTGDIPLTCTY